MSRTEQGRTLAVAGLAFIGAVTGTLITGGKVTLFAGISVAAGLAIVLFGFVYSRRGDEQDEARREKEIADEKERQRLERESERRERLTKETIEHENFLNESMHCEDLRCASTSTTRPRRTLWRLPPAVSAGRAVCAICFRCRMGRDPVEGHDKHAFE